MLLSQQTFPKPQSIAAGRNHVLRIARQFSVDRQKNLRSLSRRLHAAPRKHALPRFVCIPSCRIALQIACVALPTWLHPRGIVSICPATPLEGRLELCRSNPVALKVQSIPLRNPEHLSTIGNRLHVAMNGRSMGHEGQLAPDHRHAKRADASRR